MDKRHLVDAICQAVIEQLRHSGVTVNGTCPADDARQVVVSQEDHVRAFLAAGACRLSSGPGVKECKAELSHLIDHTLLKPDATEAAVRTLCEEARQIGFASVCVNPAFVPLCREMLTGSAVKVCTVIGFPLGANKTATKVFETREAIYDGAQEVDMVINVGALKSGQFDQVEADIRGVVEAASPNVIVKVIIETALLTDDEKIKACVLAMHAGAHFVKTSTGFGPGGATIEDIWLMRQVVGSQMGVKASGGVRDFEAARQMVTAGASRIGASAGVKIVSNAS